MDISNLLKHPLIKIIAILTIVYFGFFKDNKHPDSLANRLNIDNVKKNLGEVKDKISDISQNIEMAKNYKNKISAEKKISELKFIEIEKGNGDQIIKCTDKVKLIYKYSNISNQILDFMENLELTPWQNYDDLTQKIIAQNLEGYKAGSVIRANLVGQFIDADEKIKKILEIANYELILEIYILSFSEGEDIKCNKNN